MDRVECRNAVCTCKYEFNKDSEKQQCIRIVAKSEYTLFLVNFADLNCPWELFTLE